MLSYYLTWPDATRLTVEGFGKVARIPVVFDSRWSYQTAPSQYLRERALRTYLPRNYKRAVTELTPRSIQTFGESICNFLEWCALHSKDWTTLDYENDILQGYQNSLVSGTFSSKRRGLSPSTANGRVEEACNFLEWAYQRNLRAEFAVTTKTVFQKIINPKLSHGHVRTQAEVRFGAVRQKPASLTMPPKSAVESWLESIRIEKGYSKYLMAELVLRTGIRREEAVQWRLHTLPRPEQWISKGGEIQVLLEYGTKGSKRKNERGDIVGPARTIMLPVELAKKLDAYRETKRLKYFALYVKTGKTAEDRRRRQSQQPEQLFLSDYTGLPISSQTFYDAWTEASRVPYKGWSPHLGRHYWACNELLKESQRHFEFLSKYDKAQIPLDWIRGTVSDVIILRIQPQLGHVDKKTVDLYIGWAVQQYRSGNIEDAFEKALEDTPPLDNYDRAIPEKS